MNYKQLTAADRGAIEILLQEKHTISSIAKKLGRHRSTISREINQRSIGQGYFAEVAQEDFELKLGGNKPKISNSKIKNHILDRLQRGWSPEQISGRMKLEKGEFYVCHETIYKFIYTDEYCIQEKWFQYLRYGRKKRKKKNGRSVKRSRIPNKVKIDERPSVVNERSEHGHWEGDSVIYPNKKAINTLNELQTGLVAFTKLESRKSKETVEAMIKQLGKYRAKTVTVDNGSEFTYHEEITEKTAIAVYFCDPYSSWQRGSNENSNMLLRGYLPKRTNIDDLTQEELDDIVWELNNRPRKRLGWKTPVEVYKEKVYSLNAVAVDL